MAMDYYQTLGVARTASPDEIKSAYRKMARKYHPDVNKEPDAEAKFKEVGEAYDVLGNNEKRAAYDHLGPDWKAAMEGRRAPGADPRADATADGFAYSEAARGGSAHDASDFYEDLFTQMGRGRARQGGQSGGQSGGTRKTRRTEFNMRGEDRHVRIAVDLRDTFEGAKRELQLRMPEFDADGNVAVRDRTLSVQIPKGVLAGQHIRLKGQGDPGIGKGEPGDLYLEVEFKPDPLYRVHERDLFVDLPVAPWELALGASVRMPTPAGAIMLKVPPGSAPGRELRIKGRGIPAKDPGDLYAVLKVVLPPADSAEAKAAYEALAKASGSFDPRAGFGG